jgi:hypothetical protein
MVTPEKRLPTDALPQAEGIPVASALPQGPAADTDADKLTLTKNEPFWDLSFLKFIQKGAPPR